MWALAYDRQAADGLRQQAEALQTLLRPTVLTGRPADLPALLAAQQEEPVRFDAVVGRSVVQQAEDRAAALRAVWSVLLPGGVLSWASHLLRPVSVCTT